MTFVRCQFCQKPCRVAYENINRHSAGRKYYRCDYHGAVVVKHIPPDKPEGMHVTIMAVLYRDTTYECSFFYNRDVGEKFRIDKMNQPPRTVETVVTLDFHPDISPENIAGKLPTYILFS